VAIVRLKGLNRLTKTLADGTRVTYFYAWKGGPRLPGKPGSPEFVAAYNDAVKDRRQRPKETLALLVSRYRQSPEFTGNSAAVQAEWGRWLAKIESDDIGELSFKALDDRRVRADLLEWRDQWQDRPRAADYAIQVLRRVLSWGVDRGLLERNAAAGVAELYSSNRADQMWDAGELARYRAAAPSPEVGFIAPLACLTGFRRTDLTQLAWPHVGDIAIKKPTSKSRGRAVQTVPLLPETRELLAQIRKQQLARHRELCALAERKGRSHPPMPVTVLSNTRGKPWTPDGLEAQVIKTKKAAQIDKHLHDARGTFATRLRKAGLDKTQIAMVLAWEEDRVERLLNTYVDDDPLILEIARKLNEA